MQICDTSFWSAKSYQSVCTFISQLHDDMGCRRSVLYSVFHLPYSISYSDSLSLPALFLPCCLLADALLCLVGLTWLNDCCSSLVASLFASCFLDAFFLLVVQAHNCAFLSLFFHSDLIFYLLFYLYIFCFSGKRKRKRWNDEGLKCVNNCTHDVVSMGCTITFIFFSCGKALSTATHTFHSFAPSSFAFEERKRGTRLWSNALTLSVPIRSPEWRRYEMVSSLFHLQAVSLLIFILLFR